MNENILEANLSGLSELDAKKLSITLYMINESYKVFRLFLIPITNHQDITDSDSTKLWQFAWAQLKAHVNSTSMLSQASQLMEHATQSDNPHEKLSEYATMIELLIGIGMIERPQYFTAALQENSSENYLNVAYKFFKEFISEGVLDSWHMELKNKYSSEDISDSELALLELIDLIVWYLKFIVSEEAKQPDKHPLNKYTTAQEFAELYSLKDWLTQNKTSTDYQEKCLRYHKLDRKISAGHTKALEEAFKRLSALLKRIAPEIFPSLESSNAQQQIKINRANQEKQAFINYVIDRYDNEDIFESNNLRSFQEKVSRRQFGKIYHKMICEGFLQEFAESITHKKIQQIWALSLLDTIHIHPKEAKTRMPGSSIDGLPAPNFGWKMERSEAYQNWCKNLLVRANADIIMDAFYCAVDFGINLDIEQFIEDFINPSNQQERGFYRHFEYAFKTYFLKKRLGKKYTPRSAENLLAQMRKDAKEDSKAKEELAAVLDYIPYQFTKVCNEIFALRSNNSGNNTGKERVMGIGFNGQQFDSPTHRLNKDEIWLCFSKAGRTEGGFVLLEFIADIARYSNILNPVLLFDLEDSDGNFIRYKPLIKLHVKQQLKNTHNPSFLPKKKEQFESFMLQLESEMKFKYLTFELRQWIQHVPHWYRTSPGVRLRISKEVPEQERKVHDFARKLLFDALTLKQFSEHHPNLMPKLFIHWKNFIIDEISRLDSSLVETIKAENNLNKLSQDNKIIVIKIINQLMQKVHPELRAVWQPSIEKKFSALKDKEVKPLQKQLASINKKLKTLTQAELKAKNLIKAAAISKQVVDEQKKADELNAQISIWPTSAAELTKEQHTQFKEYFFERVDELQCVEPAFARVIGHDRFFSIFISPKGAQAPLPDSLQPTKSLKLGNYLPQDAIAPCDAKCQYHALGQLATADLFFCQSADQLDQARRVHEQEEVPDRFMTLKELRSAPTLFKPSNPLSKQLYITNRKQTIIQSCQQPENYCLEYQGDKIYIKTQDKTSLAQLKIINENVYFYYLDSDSKDKYELLGTVDLITVLDRQLLISHCL